MRPGEIGSVQYIKEHAEKNGCNVYEYELKAQFRCNGSDAFVNWINNTLGIKRTANTIWDLHEEFDFQILDSPEELEAAIRSKVDEGFNGRLTAGFCWPWSRKPNGDGSLYNDVVIGDYKRPWNARPDATKLAKNIPKSNFWAHDPNGIDQIGCIYTAQGFEFDYVGVIFGKDLVYNLDGQKWDGHVERSEDTVVKRSKGMFTNLVKNTYRVLLSRGMKGCYVYFEDKDTERFFKTRIESNFNIPLAIISGGNSSSIELLLDGNIPDEINNLRLGESIVLGRETAYGSFIDNTYSDIFTLEAEIIELKEKPSIPIGKIGMNAFGKVPSFIDKGNMLRAILSIGKQDVDFSEIIPFDTIELLGSSSDHIIVDVSDTVKIYNIGDIIRFKLTYASILSLMTSKYVSKYYE